MKISVVIPVYGCREALPELYERLVKVLAEIADEYEIVLVNDGCPQNSWEMIEQLCARDKCVVGIEMARNFGQMKAILAGLDYSSGDWVVVMDCDLQDRPEEIKTLYDKAMDGYDAVFARRKERKDSFFKIWTSKLFHKILSAMSDGNYDSEVCNFSILNRSVVDAFCKMRELHRAYVIYVKWLGFRQTEIDIPASERKEGKSSYSFQKRLALAEEILISQSDKLLRAMVYFGVLVVFCSLAFILAVVARYFLYDITPGWSSILCTILFVGGVLMLSVGIVGLYVGYIFMQVKERPLYVVRSVVNGEVKS